MNIGIVGSGLMGSALGTVWAQRGHQVSFSYSRDRHKLEALARQTGARAATPAEAVASADAVLLAVTWKQLDNALAQAGSLSNKILLSCMLPMTADDSALALGFNTSGAEELAQRTQARVIGTFNSVWSDVIRAQRDYAGARPSMFYVGDDAAAKRTAETLIRDAGFEPVDVGELKAARLLEPFGLLMGQMGFAVDPQVAYQFLKP